MQPWCKTQSEGLWPAYESFPVDIVAIESTETFLIDVKSYREAHSVVVA